MKGASLNRVRLAAAVAAGSAASIVALLAVSPADGGPAALTPDLVVLPVQEKQLIVRQEGTRTLLRMTTEVGNHANGPLEVFPSAVSADCDADGDLSDDRDASQRIYEDTDGSGGFDSEADAVLSERSVGCMRYHAAHDHWHVLDFARYELRRMPGGGVAEASRKVGYCLVDTRAAFPGPFTPAGPGYPYGAAGDTACDHQATQGISAGWADSYVFALPGQQLDVTDLPRGRYCLITRVDPLNLLEELNDDNNTARARIALRPGHFSVRKLGDGCPPLKP